MDSLRSFQNLARDIKLPLKQSKTCLPNTVAILFGIEIDTVLGEMRLPQDKLNSLRTLLDQATKHNKMTVREVQSLLGF